MDRKDSEFHDFLLAEYAHIADAHFKTNEAVTGLFQQYFTIAAIPITALVVAVSLESTQSALTAHPTASLTVGFVLFVLIAVIGYMVLVHMSNLSFDAILYARTINGLRKHYYDLSDSVDLASMSLMRVLPQSPLKPRYLEGISGFVPFIITLSLVNGVYLFLGLVCLQLAWDPATAISSLPVWVNVPTGTFLGLHVLTYIYLAQYRESDYLRSNIIGVDIDGVLNRQPKQFCDFLQRSTQKKIQVQQIVTIPVSDCIGLGVSSEDEKAVFNDPRYWIEMPAADGASQVLVTLRDSMKLKVHMFTNRRWPIPVGLSQEEARQTSAEWVRQSEAFEGKIIMAKPLSQRVGYSFSGFWRMWWPYRARKVRDWFIQEAPIDQITRAWLDIHGFKYDSLMIEKGSAVVADPALQVRNRFYASRTHSIRYFVEDDLVNAKKLAYICDVVFLIDQPYNRSVDLPKNILRVSGWKDILIHMRQLA